MYKSMNLAEHMCIDMYIYKNIGTKGKHKTLHKTSLSFILLRERRLRSLASAFLTSSSISCVCGEQGNGGMGKRKE
jgi:hypothetical protein